MCRIRFPLQHHALVINVQNIAKVSTQSKKPTDYKFCDIALLITVICRPVSSDITATALAPLLSDYLGGQVDDFDGSVKMIVNKLAILI